MYKLIFTLQTIIDLFSQEVNICVLTKYIFTKNRHNEPKKKHQQRQLQKTNIMIIETKNRYLRCYHHKEIKSETQNSYSIFFS